MEDSNHEWKSHGSSLTFLVNGRPAADVWFSGGKWHWRTAVAGSDFHDGLKDQYDAKSIAMSCIPSEAFA